jgi:hypothetical protein
MNFNVLNSICASLVLFRGMYSILSSAIFNYFIKEVIVNPKKWFQDWLLKGCIPSKKSFANRRIRDVLEEFQQCSNIPEPSSASLIFSCLIIHLKWPRKDVLLWYKTRIAEPIKIRVLNISFCLVVPRNLGKRAKPLRKRKTIQLNLKTISSC